MIVIIPECQECKKRKLRESLNEFTRKWFPRDYEEAKKELELMEDPS